VVGLDAGAAQALGGAALTVVTLPLAAWAAGWSPSSRSEPRLARARVGLPLRNLHFVGREELLARLRADLAGGASAVAVLALRGMGGVGKTQVAIEYAYRFGGDYDLVGWVDAEQPALVAEQVAGGCWCSTTPSGPSTWRRFCLVAAGMSS
jgi:hypothetical protein